MKKFISLFFLGLYGIGLIIRSFIYKMSFGSYGKKSYILGKIIVYDPHLITFGNNSTLNEGVLLNASGGIIIGNNVHISTGVIINSVAIDLKNFTEKKHKLARVTIKDGVWISSGAIINPGITIEKNSVVGAGAVVTRNVPPNTLVVGVPAKPLKKINV